MKGKGRGENMSSTQQTGLSAPQERVDDGRTPGNRPSSSSCLSTPPRSGCLISLCLFPHFAFYSVCPHLQRPHGRASRTVCHLCFSPSAQKQTGGGVLTFWKAKASCILSSACFSRRVNLFRVSWCCCMFF